MVAGHVIYWMSRDQRTHDNWALLYACALAREHRTAVEVAFCLTDHFSGSGLRQFTFMLKGLEQVKLQLEESGIRFHFLVGEPSKLIPRLVLERKATMLVTDFEPLHFKQQWKQSVAARIGIPFHEVDAHNIVPCRMTSSKAAYGAYTLRPAISRKLPVFLVKFPKLPITGPPVHHMDSIDADQVVSHCRIDKCIPVAGWIEPGEKGALQALDHFVDEKLEKYADLHADPTRDACSKLSPYLHFGQLSAQRVALEILKRVPRSLSGDAFLEELIVRRELSDNFCLYQPGYDTFEGFPEWARRSLDAHRKDEREYCYTAEQFEKAATHDPLWNAAQRQLTITGYMHGYMRMYWAKKILEWTPSPEEALQTAICLNDKYGLDGCDPNGYAGCAWSIGGVHDRAWAERPVYGKIRYMNSNGAKRKFDVQAYIYSWS